MPQTVDENKDASGSTCTTQPVTPTVASAEAPVISHAEAMERALQIVTRENASSESIRLAAAIAALGTDRGVVPRMEF